MISPETSYFNSHPPNVCLNLKEAVTLTDPSSEVELAKALLGGVLGRGPDHQVVCAHPGIAHVGTGEVVMQEVCATSSSAAFGGCVGSEVCPVRVNIAMSGLRLRGMLRSSDLLCESLCGIG